MYQSEDGRTRIAVRIEGESTWLSQAAIAELYQTTPQNITLHIRNIYADGELKEAATCKDYLQVRKEGAREVERSIRHYNLEMILAVGYRVRSARGVQFRRWATQILREYIVKGFALDDERLKQADHITDYFDELLARIREIRASEARVYQRIREIFALAADYREGEEETKRFFAVMQNKMHYAATGLTAAEIVNRRADATQPNMGLSSWQGRRVLRRDVGTAKNYLDADEIDTLNRITVMFLDQAEFRAQRRRSINMGDWGRVLDTFLHQTELPVLDHAGSVSHESALEHANDEYEEFARRRREEAEEAGEAHYMDELRQSAKELEGRQNPAADKQNRGKKGK